jgi:hypothetical protein
MTELGMRICRKPLSVINHAFNGSIGPISCSVVNINAFKLNVKGTDVLSVETNDILSDNLDLGLFHLLTSPLLSSLLDAHCHIP